MQQDWIIKGKYRRFTFSWKMSPSREKICSSIYTHYPHKDMEHQFLQYEMLLDDHLPYYSNVSKM
jgi:hypothetical protein